MAETMQPFMIRVPPELVAKRDLLFVGGPLHGQERPVYGILPDPREELPDLPPLLWHTADDGSQHAYMLVEDCSLDAVVDAPLYKHDREFPPPSECDASSD